MKKNKLLLLLTIQLFIIPKSFSQEKEYIVIDNLKNGKNSEVYEVKEIRIKTTKYEYKEIDNPEYREISETISALELEFEKLNGKDLSTYQINALKKAKKLLEIAINKSKNKKADINLDNAIESLFSSGKKWTELKSAKKELDKTNLNFVQNTKGKFTKAIEQAELNTTKIDDLLGLTKSKKEKANKILSNLSRLKKKIGVGGSYIGNNNDRIYKTISKNVPVGKIERKIFILDTINAYNQITGKFTAIDNSFSSSPNYSILTKSFRRFVKNELLSKDTIQKYDIPNEITKSIGNYSHRYNDQDKYLIKSVNDNKIYFTNDNILNKIAVEAKEYELFKILKNNNIKLINEGRKTYVSKNGVKCVLTKVVKQELLNNNVNIINQTVSSVKQYNIYYTQALKILDIVSKHYQSYQSGTMTKNRLAKWKNDTKKLISVNKKMNDLNYGKYKDDISSDLAYQYFMSYNKQLTREQVQAGSVISDMIRECKQIIGM